MRHRLLRHPLGRGVDAEAVFLALYGDATDVFWLDGGPAGTSYVGAGRPVRPGADPFAALADELADVGVLGTDHELDPSPLPAFRLGLVGWLGYELRGLTTGAAVHRVSPYPDAAALRVERAIAVHAPDGRAELLALGEDWTGELADWRDRTERVVRESVTAPPPAPPARPDPASARWAMTDREYLAAIAECRRAIRDGEAYQLCLTNTAEIDAPVGSIDPVDVYRRLRRTSPTSRGGLIRIGEVALASASPERFLSIDPDGTIETSPIKGTRPRSPDPDLDDLLAAELLASEKERAENLMIVDLMRNDLARVCEPGSVEVTRLLKVESYAQVHQLVSTVRGRLRHDATAVDAVRACFPAGSMTGAPKRRATELLDGIEGRARGLYAGCFGYLGLDGAAELAMTIRSIVLGPGGATLGSGGGITALSDPDAELAEVRIKAAPLLAALGAA